MAAMKPENRKGGAYFVRVGFAMPRSMAEDLDQLLLRDGRRQGEYLRSLVAQALREDRQHNLASRPVSPTASPASRPPDDSGRSGRQQR